MYQNVKRTCRAIVFAHLTYCFAAFSLPSPSSLLQPFGSREQNFTTHLTITFSFPPITFFVEYKDPRISLQELRAANGYSSV